MGHEKDGDEMELFFAPEPDVKSPSMAIQGSQSGKEISAVPTLSTSLDDYIVWPQTLFPVWPQTLFPENLIQLKSQERRIDIMEDLIQLKQDLLDSTPIWSQERRIDIMEDLIRLKQDLLDSTPKMSQERRIDIMEDLIRLKQDLLDSTPKMSQECRIDIMSGHRRTDIMEDLIQLKLDLLNLKPNMSRKMRTVMMEKVISMVKEVNKLKSREGKADRTEQSYHFFRVILLAAIAYLLFCAVLTKAVLQKQLLLKFAFGRAALLLLWTSGDVEKHPGPLSVLVLASIRALVTRLVKKLQGGKVANWKIKPPNWNQNIVFQDINKMKDSNNAEKYALYYAAIQATIKTFGDIPNWCREEITYVETGNELELQKCQTSRKIRELLKKYERSEQDIDDIFRRAGYPRQSGNLPAQAVRSLQPSSSTNGQQQRIQNCPYNVPGYQPINDINDATTAGLIAEGCLAQSIAAKTRSCQTKTSKRPASTKALHPTPKKRLVSANTAPAASLSLSAPTSTATQPSTPTDVKPSSSSTANVSQNERNTKAGTSATQCNGTQPDSGRQPLNLVSLPPDDLEDMGFSSEVDLDGFITQIMKDDKTN